MLHRERHQLKLALAMMMRHATRDARLWSFFGPETKLPEDWHDWTQEQYDQWIITQPNEVRFGMEVLGNIERQEGVVKVR